MNIQYQNLSGLNNLISLPLSPHYHFHRKEHLQQAHGLHTDRRQGGRPRLAKARVSAIAAHSKKGTTARKGRAGKRHPNHVHRLDGWGLSSWKSWFPLAMILFPINRYLLFIIPFLQTHSAPLFATITLSWNGWSSCAYSLSGLGIRPAIPAPWEFIRIKWKW